MYIQAVERNLALGLLTVWVQKEQKGLAGPAGNSPKDSWFGKRRKCSQIIKDDNGCFLFCQADLFFLHRAFYIGRERGGVFLHGIKCRTAEEAAAKLAPVPSSDLSYIMGSSQRWAVNSALSCFLRYIGLTKLSLGGNNLYMPSLFPPRESLVSGIPAGEENIENPFLRCSLIHSKKFP